MKVLGVLTWLVMTVVGSALLHSWALSKLWLWFVSAQYGAGPSLGAWFGLVSIARLTVASADSKLSIDGDGDAITKLVLSTIVHWGGILLALGAAWLSGSTIGWVH